MFATLRSTIIAAGMLTCAGAMAQFAPNLITYGTFEEPFGTCPIAPPGEIVMKLGYNCVQMYPSCGSYWWRFQRHSFLNPGAFMPGSTPKAFVINSVPSTTVPIPISGNRMVAFRMNTDTPNGGSILSMHQNLATPLVPGHTYFMRWRFKALAPQSFNYHVAAYAIHGNNPLCSIPSIGQSFNDYQGLQPTMWFETVTAVPQFLDGLGAKTFTATAANDYIGLRFLIYKAANATWGTLYVDDIELYDLADGQVPPLVNFMPELSEAPTAYLPSKSLHGDDATEQKLVAWPNPSTGTFQLNCGSSNGEGRITVYNATGGLVQQFVPLTENNCVVDLSKEPTGMYHVCYSDGDRTRSIRVVKD